MKVEIYRREDGVIRSFAISNLFLGRRGFVRVIEKIPGVRITRRPKLLISWFVEDIFCEFRLDGACFLADEPFGDNSFYDVTCDNPDGPIQRVVAQFEKQQLPFGL